MLKTCRRMGLMFLGLLTAMPVPGAARENVFTGGFALRHEYDSNVNLSATAREENWFTVLAPEVHVTSRGRTNQLQTSYKLGFKKNHTTGEENFDHDFLLEGDTSFTSRWQAGVVNRFFLADDPDYGGTPVQTVDQELSARRERNRFWTNTFSLHSDFHFAKESTLTTGYENRILDNKAAALDDYIRHHPFVTIGYQFNRRWRGEWRYGYIRGEFDHADDLETHTGSLRLAWQATLHDQLAARYNYNQTSYEGQTADYRIHTIHGDWQRELDPRMTLTTTAGLSRVERENRGDQDIFSYSADLTRQLRRGQITISGEGGVDELQFAGTGDGLSRYWQVGGAGQLQLQKQLRANLALSGRHDDFIDQPGTSEEDFYQASCGFFYSISSLYEVSLRYLYKELNGVGREADYQDHRLYLELKVVDELVKL